MNRIMRNILIFATVYLSICLMLFPKGAVEEAKNAVFVCLGTVIPALFPYLVCSGFLSSSGFASVFSRYLSPVMRPIFNIPGSGAIALVLGTVSGYPIGAVCAKDLYLSGECTKSEAEKLLAFCNNSGPLFIVSVVGATYLNSPRLGQILYIAHIMSAILVGIILRTYSSGKSPMQKALPSHFPQSSKKALCIFGTVIDNSVFSILKICGFVVFFTVFSKSLPKTIFSPYIHGLLEITGGVREIASLSIDFQLKLSLISFLVAFSGISVFFQVAAIASKYDLSLKPYILGKFLQGIFSALLTKIMVSNLHQSVDVFKGFINVPSTKGSLLCSLFMLFFALALLVLAVFVAKIISCRK